ncbi:MAG TPA: glycosyltransferase family 2 protein, partial [Solirubrobacteraceae bacterium]|nr:glycosyltransferase family 2 protein [Solirubrobacteraceae bacterium]
MTLPATTVLLLSVDEAEALAQSLPAALAQDGAEVIVVDNACGDRTAEIARAAGARVLELERRLSYAAAINEALRRSAGDAVLLLNADCVLEPGFLAAARPRLQEAAVGSVAPKLVRASEPALEHTLGVIDAAGMTVDRRRKNGLVGHGLLRGAHERPGEAFGADGAAALYRRETLMHCALGDEVL